MSLNTLNGYALVKVYPLNALPIICIPWNWIEQLKTQWVEFNYSVVAYAGLNECESSMKNLKENE
jgi:hypothetical protein